MRKLKLLLAACALFGVTATVWAQKDVTSLYITNATLSNGTNGWTVSNFNTPVNALHQNVNNDKVYSNATIGYASEAYAGWGSLEKTSYSLTQIITLPAGNYTLVNYSFFRQGEAHNTNPEKSLAFLKAGEKQVPIKTLGSIATNGYANSQWEGAGCFDSKMYRNTIDFTIDNDNTNIEIGLVGTFDEMKSWCIAGMFELINNDIPATIDAPFDVTGYITNSGFEYRDLTGWSLSEENAFGTQNNNQDFKTAWYYAEKWQPSQNGALSARSMSQTISNLPAGFYKLTANLGGNGTYIDLNGKTVNWEADKDYTVGYVLAENENLVITAGKTPEGTANWIHFDNFRLQFCGNVAAALNTLCAKVAEYESKLPSADYSILQTSVNEYNKTYSNVEELLAAIDAVQTLYESADLYITYIEALSAARDVDQTAKMNNDVLVALQEAINKEITISSSITEKIDATNALKTAKDNVATSIAKYTEAKAILNAANTFDASGQGSYAANETIADIQANYNNGTLIAVSAEQKTAANEALVTAAKAQITSGSDMTLAIVNPSFENEFNGWTSNGLQSQNNNSFEKDGNKYVEKWQPNGTFGATQVIKAMPSGVFQLSAKIKARGMTSAKLFANGVEQSVTIGDVTNTYNVIFACDANTEFTIGFEGVGTGVKDSWFCADDFKLTLINPGLPDVTAVEGKMNAEIAAEQTTAINTYKANKTVENYNAAVAAITKAQTSIDAYRKIEPIFNKLDAALTAATSKTENTSEYDAIKAAYNNGTIADNDIPAQGIAAYDAVIPVIKSQTAAQADFTFAIQNQSFEYGDFTGWTTSATSSDTNIHSTSDDTYAMSGSDGDYLFNTWWQGVALTQTIENLPNGQYTLTVTVASDEGATIYLLANGDHNDGTATTKKIEGIDATYTFLVKDGIATIGTVGSAEDGSYTEAGHWWYKADNFRLIKNRDLTDEEKIVPATAEDLQNLNDAIESAEAKTLGFEKDEYAPYNNVEALTALAAAKAIDQTAENLNQATVQEATTALTGATWTPNTEEVNAIYDGDFAIQELPSDNTNIRPLGWARNSVTANVNNGSDGGYETRLVAVPEGATSTNKGMMTKFHSFYGDQIGYQLPLKANTSYVLSFRYGGWGNTPTMHINVYSEDGTKITASTDFTANSGDGNTGAANWTDYSYVFKTTDAGNYVLGFIKNSGGTEQRQMGFGDISLVKAATATMSITEDAQYATFCAPFDVTIPEGVSAYTVTSLNQATLALTDVETTIPANTPVVLFSESTVNEEFAGAAIEGTPSNGLLTGVYAETDAPVGSYVMQKQGVVTGFYKVAEGKQPTVPANRAYLTAPSEARALYFNNATAIRAIEALTSGEAEIYNAAGARQNSLQKGVNIIKQGNKTFKVMVK